MEHLMENDVESNSEFDNLLGRKAKRRIKRRRADRKRGRKMRLRAKYGGIASGYGRPAPRPNAYADAGIGTQVQEAEIGANPVSSGMGWIGGGGSSALEKGRGFGLIGKLIKRRKKRNRKHKKLLRAINNPKWLTDPRNHWKLKDAVRKMAIDSNNDGKVAEKMEHFRKSKLGSIFKKGHPRRRFPVGQSWLGRKPMLRGSHHLGFDGEYFNADGSAKEKGFFAKNWWIIALVGGGAFLFLTPQGKKLMGKITGK